ncbi:MAG: hypothetical protein JJU06_07495 [Ectothiorhodospiraceae bacterium]|nr:hypothetical protein [Ectothiorhodospiraceae bacterium]MCH8502768.1 hypothetical protein [Ectothiorhodospiraceae bacterium]
MPNAQVIEMIRMGNLQGIWRPFLMALRSGYVDTGYQRLAADGTLRPTLLTMIMIKAPMEVVSAAVEAGARCDPDHLMGAAASGETAKLQCLLERGLLPEGMSMAPEFLLLAAANSGSVEMLTRIWSLPHRWDAARAREEVRVFDCVVQREHAERVIPFLLERGIGPSGRWMAEGTHRQHLSAGIARQLLARGWQLPAAQVSGGNSGAHRASEIVH